MSINFSKEQDGSNVTFDKLNMFINQWTWEIQECQNVFSLQQEELSKQMFGICSCRDKLKTLHERVIFAKCFQDGIEQTIDYVRMRQDDIEQMVTKLEIEVNVDSLRNSKVSADIYRENTYKMAENLNAIYLNFLDAVEELQNHTGQIKQKYNDPDNVEYIAQLLQHQLQQLENIDMKIYDMKNRLNQTEYYKRNVLGSLHIKENTF